MAQRVSLEPQQLTLKYSYKPHRVKFQTIKLSLTYKLPAPRHWEAEREDLYWGTGIVTTLWAFGIDWIYLLRNGRVSLSAWHADLR